MLELNRVSYKEDSPLEDIWIKDEFGGMGTEPFPLVDEFKRLPLATLHSVTSIGMGSSQQRNTSMGPFVLLRWTWRL